MKKFKDPGGTITDGSEGAEWCECTEQAFL